MRTMRGSGRARRHYNNTQRRRRSSGGGAGANLGTYILAGIIAFLWALWSYSPGLVIAIVLVFGGLIAWATRRSWAG